MTVYSPAELLIMLLASMWSYIHPPMIGRCEAVDGPRFEFSTATRAEVKRRNIAAAEAMGWGPIFVSYFDAVAERESTYNSSVRHRLGKRENGLGLHGLGSIHRAKWPGEWEDMCTPEASLMVTSEIVHIAVEKYGAASILDVQHVFAGRLGCVGAPQPCTDAQQDRTFSAICGRMSARGFSCNERLLGWGMAPRVPLDERREVAERLTANNEERATR